MQTITNNSFTITHYRTSVTRSFWEIVSFYNYELTQWLIKHGDIDPNISVEENEEESIITYNNDNILDTNIVITILSNKNDETTCISENSIIADELKRDDFQQFLKKATERTNWKKNSKQNVRLNMQENIFKININKNI